MIRLSESYRESLKTFLTLEKHRTSFPTTNASHSIYWTLISCSSLIHLKRIESQRRRSYCASFIWLVHRWCRRIWNQSGFCVSLGRYCGLFYSWSVLTVNRCKCLQTRNEYSKKYFKYPKNRYLTIYFWRNKSESRKSISYHKHDATCSSDLCGESGT